MSEKKEAPSWVAKAADQNRVPSVDFARIYANNFAMGMSNWDLSLTFGEIVGEKDGQAVIEEKVKVTMALAHAKAMLHLLGEHIANYEKVMGEIKIPGSAEMAALKSAAEPADESKSEAQPI
jgi:hypothetical protein